MSGSRARAESNSVIVGDSNKARLELVKKAGYEVVDTSKDVPLPDEEAGRFV